MLLQLVVGFVLWCWWVLTYARCLRIQQFCDRGIGMCLYQKNPVGERSGLAFAGCMTGASRLLQRFGQSVTSWTESGCPPPRAKRRSWTNRQAYCVTRTPTKPTHLVGSEHLEEARKGGESARADFIRSAIAYLVWFAIPEAFSLS